MVSGLCMLCGVVGWRVVGLVGWLFGWLVGWLVGCLVGCLIGWLVLGALFPCMSSLPSPNGIQSGAKANWLSSHVSKPYSLEVLMACHEHVSHWVIHACAPCQDSRARHSDLRLGHGGQVRDSPPAQLLQAVAAAAPGPRPCPPVAKPQRRYTCPCMLEGHDDVCLERVIYVKPRRGKNCPSLSRHPPST